MSSNKQACMVEMANKKNQQYTYNMGKAKYIWRANKRRKTKANNAKSNKIRVKSK